MEGSPEQIDVRAMQQEIAAVDGVKEVHDLHVWSISSSEHAVTCHVLIGEMTDDQAVLRLVTERIRTFGSFKRSTVQIEREHQGCEDRIIW